MIPNELNTHALVAFLPGRSRDPDKAHESLRAVGQGHLSLSVSNHAVSILDRAMSKFMSNAPLQWAVFQVITHVVIAVIVVKDYVRSE